MNQMLNPFLKLGIINDNILSIMSYMNELDNNELDNKNLSNRLTDLYRKSFIMQMLSDKYIVAVTGIQGVGKTTFLKKLYNIEDNILLANQGRGEKLPILFTETKSEEKKAYIYRISRQNSSIFIKKDQIEKHEVNSLSSNYEPKTDLFLELEVSEFVFGCDSKHFLLLPGIESEDSYMNDLTWSAIRTAANCVIVTFVNAYANVKNRQLTDKLKQEFMNSEPIFILSMADQSTDKNEGFKKTVMNDLNIDSEDRIVITGVSDDLMSVWPYEFKKSVQRYSNSPSVSFSIKCTNMEKLLEDINKLRLDIKTFLEKTNIVNQVDELKVANYIAPFNNEFKKIRDEISDVFTQHMSNFENIMNKFIGSKIEEKSWGTVIWDKIFKREISALIGFQNMIVECLKEASQCHFIEKGFLKAIAKSQAKYLYKEKSIDDSLDELSKALTLTNTDQNCSINDQDLIQDIQHLYYPKRYNNTPKVSDNMESNLKIIPHIFNELLRVNYFIPDAHFQGDVNNLIIPYSEDSVKQVLHIYSEYKPTLANAMGAIVGFDMAMDGQLDLFNLLESAIPQTASKLAESLTAYLGIAMIVFNAFDYLNNIVNRTQIKQLEVAGSIVSNIRKHIESQFMQNYDKSVRTFTEYTFDVIRQKFGLTKRLSTFWNLEQSLLNLKNISQEIKQEISVVPN